MIVSEDSGCSGKVKIRSIFDRSIDGLRGGAGDIIHGLVSGRSIDVLGWRKVADGGEIGVGLI